MQPAGSLIVALCPGGPGQFVDRPGGPCPVFFLLQRQALLDARPGCLVVPLGVRYLPQLVDCFGDALPISRCLLNRQALLQ